MKIQNYTKALKSNLNSCLKETKNKQKKAEVLSQFSRTHRTSTSGAQWWKHFCISGPFASSWEEVCLLWNCHMSTADLYITAVSSSSESRRAQMVSVPSLAGWTSQYAHKPWVSCSSSLSHWSFYFAFKLLQKKKRRGITSPPHP